MYPVYLLLRERTGRVTHYVTAIIMENISQKVCVFCYLF